MRASYRRNLRNYPDENCRDYRQAKTAINNWKQLFVGDFSSRRCNGSPRVMQLAVKLTDGTHTLSFSLVIGNRRIRLPVAAKIAFATAGATGGTAVSPNPPGGSSEGMM